MTGCVWHCDCPARWHSIVNIWNDSWFVFLGAQKNCIFTTAQISVYNCTKFFTTAQSVHNCTLKKTLEIWRPKHIKISARFHTTSRLDREYHISAKDMTAKDQDFWWPQNFWGSISHQLCTWKIDGWFILTANRKPDIAIPMVTWRMTPCDPQKVKIFDDPKILSLNISKTCEIDGRFK